MTRTESTSPTATRATSPGRCSPQFGFSSDQFGCLDSLWTRESQLEPGRRTTRPRGRTASRRRCPAPRWPRAGADWATNPVTQIRWGLGYIQDRYGSPCGAWAHSESHGWY